VRGEAGGVLLEPTTRCVAGNCLDYVVIGRDPARGARNRLILRPYLPRSARTSSAADGNLYGQHSSCAARADESRRSCVLYHIRICSRCFPTQEVNADRLFLADGPPSPARRGGSFGTRDYLIEQHSGPPPPPRPPHPGRSRKKPASAAVDRPRSAANAQPHPPLSETVTEPRYARGAAGSWSITSRAPSRSPRWHPSLACPAPASSRFRHHVVMGPASLYASCACVTHLASSRTPTAPSPTSPTMPVSRTLAPSPPVQGPYGLSPIDARLQPQRARQRRYRAGTGFEYRMADAPAAHPWLPFISKDQQ